MVCVMKPTLTLKAIFWLENRGLDTAFKDPQVPIPKMKEF